ACAPELNAHGTLQINVEVPQLGNVVLARGKPAGAIRKTQEPTLARCSDTGPDATVGLMRAGALRQPTPLRGLAQSASIWAIVSRPIVLTGEPVESVLYRHGSGEAVTGSTCPVIQEA